MLLLLMLLLGAVAIAVAVAFAFAFAVAVHEEEGAESQAQEGNLCSRVAEAAAAADVAQLRRQKRTYMISVLHFVVKRNRVMAGGRTLLLIKANVPSSKLFWFLFAYYCVQVQVE